MATKKLGGESRRSARHGRLAPEAETTPGSPDRSRDMVMVDLWGALLAGLLETPGEKGAGREEGDAENDEGAAKSA